MHLTRWICPLRSRVFKSEISRHFSVSSQLNEASGPTTQPQVQEEKFDFEDLKVLERTERRKAKIPPFMKNVYISDFKSERLDYPEILNKEESTELDDRVQTIEGILNSKETTEFEKEELLKRTGIYGAPAKLTQGGYAMIMTERLRYLETLSANADLANRISDHWVGLDAVKVGLSEDKLSKIISNLISGDKTITLCMNERMATSANQQDLRTVAANKYDDLWHIDGEKVCLFVDGYKLVLAKNNAINMKVFLVDPNAAGVIYKDGYVSFIDTPAQILDQGPESTLKLTTTRLDTCVLSYSILKKLIAQIENFVRGKYVSGTPYADLPLVRTKVADAMLTVYTAESMAYFTAGLMDGYEDPDTEMEVAMCRSYITERAVNCATQLLTIPGIESRTEEWTEPLNNLRLLQSKYETLDTLNILIGLMALDFVGKNIHQEVRQMRNPFFNPKFIFKKFVADRRQAKDDPKMTLYLEEHLHPSLKAHAKKLEYAALWLLYACEQVLARYGNQVYLEHNDLERIARAGTEVLAMTSVLARASRSYCIGIRNAEEEMRLAALSSERGRAAVQKLVLDCDNGEYINMDNVMRNIGRKILDGGIHQLVEKPTQRVWW